jgi:hypothetical protein
LSFNVPTKTPRSSTFDKGKNILVNEDLPQSINPLEVGPNELKKIKLNEWELYKVYRINGQQGFVGLNQFVKRMGRCTWSNVGFVSK